MSKIDDERRDKQGKKKRRGEQGKEEEGKSLRGSRLPGFEGKKNKTILNVLRTYSCLYISLFILNSFYGDED